MSTRTFDLKLLPAIPQAALKRPGQPVVPGSEVLRSVHKLTHIYRFVWVNGMNLNASDAKLWACD